MKKTSRKWLLWIVIAAAASQLSAGEGLKLTLYTGLYEPERYNLLFTGYHTFLCNPKIVNVQLGFVHPCIAEVELWLQHEGTWRNVGPVLRSESYKKNVNLTGLCGQVRIKAQHGGPGVAVTLAPGCDIPPAEKDQVTLYLDCERPSCPGFELVNSRGRDPGVGRNVRSPAMAHFQAVSDDVPWDKYQYRVAIDGFEERNVVESLHNDFSVEIAEGRHEISWNVTDGCNRSLGWRHEEYVIDNTAPDVTISKPADSGAMAFSPLTVEVLVGDRLSGIRSVKLYVDRLSPTPKAEFPGPWILDMGNSRSVSIAISQSGKHQLIVVAEDRAGNRTETSREVTVSSSTMKIVR